MIGKSSSSLASLLSNDDFCVKELFLDSAQPPVRLLPPSLLLVLLENSSSSPGAEQG